MNNHFYKLDDNHNAIPCEIDKADWSIDKRRVAETKVKNVRISTVFLGINHDFLRNGEPILFETMVFGGKYDEEQERYTTWEKAEAGHKRWVKKIKKKG